MKEWITGRNPVYEVLRAKRRHVFRLLLAKGMDRGGHVNEIIKLAHARKLQIEEVPRNQLDNTGMNHQGIALQASAYPMAAMDEIILEAGKRGERLFVLVLDEIQDPQNLGTLLRSAEAVGIHGIVLPFRRTASVTPAVVSASSGAVEHLLITQVNLAQAIAELKSKGAWIVGLEGGAGSIPIEEVDLSGDVVIVVGSEGSGMRPLTRKLCDHLVRLPMQGQVDSLNAAVAGSVALYHALQARQK
ncbi:MAG: 23S rRNA (guanosine(2251)-2'-O)-methyltransferase RlmB [Anaerolineaceae bacterium]|jgi:23S rRNA (guanosine2251-2'-O)-methyltransferase|nr:23S rRNA (guanosine(2251)-2'-O)-methyltransferase RlmB [Anaerolineaceae bacterium]